MLKRFTYKKMVWVDLESPTSSELQDVVNEFKITPHIAEELRIPSLKSKVELYKDVIYLILHFPAYKHSHISDSNQEVDFVIGKNFLITVHYDIVDSIDKFSKEFEVDSILKKGDVGSHAGFIFYRLINKLYTSLGHELEFMASSLDEIEEHIFSGQEKEMVRYISEVGRDLLNFKQATSTHADVLSSFEVAARGFFGSDFDYYSKKILGEYFKVARAIEHHRESLLELRDTNNSLLSTKQNEAMKIVSIMAFVTFPLSLIASIMGMNTDYLPIVGWPGDFWFVIALMLFLVFLFYLFFKKKGWL
jgi:magnesium transporter